MASAPLPHKLRAQHARLALCTSSLRHASPRCLPGSSLLHTRARPGHRYILVRPGTTPLRPAPAPAPADRLDGRSVARPSHPAWRQASMHSWPERTYIPTYTHARILPPPPPSQKLESFWNKLRGPQGSKNLVWPFIIIPPPADSLLVPAGPREPRAASRAFGALGRPSRGLRWAETGLLPVQSPLILPQATPDSFQRGGGSPGRPRAPAARSAALPRAPAWRNQTLCKVTSSPNAPHACTGILNANIGLAH